MQGPNLLDISVEIGTLMLSHGAEIHRVEDTVCRVAGAYGSTADVFAIPTSLVVTITAAGGDSFTRTRRIYRRDTNLGQVDRLNALARRICEARPEADAVARELDDIKRAPVYSPLQQTAAGALVAGSFALLFSGGPAEGFIALCAGALVKALSLALERAQAGMMLSNVVCGALSGLLSMVASTLWPGVRSDILIISLLMLLVPGLAITNSMRDLIAGDLVTGVMKVTEALLIAAGISIGVALSLSLWRAATGALL